MSEQFNQELSLGGKIPCGLFNTMFEFTGSWQKDAAATKSLAFDGWFITLFTVGLTRSQIVLRDHVKKDVPSSWDPAALARFIEKYGTHIVVGVKMGGKDVIYVKQQHNSNLQPAEVQQHVKAIADQRFSDASGRYDIDSEEVLRRGKHDIMESFSHFHISNTSISMPSKEGFVIVSKRRGGTDKNIPHNQWLATVPLDPDVISMSFIPITSLLNGVPGSGFLSHAINLYLRYKPPIEELHQFFEFQLPRQWAPVFSELALGPQRRQQSNAALQFSFLGPKLYVNTDLVDVGKRPVTGLRLFLEGKKNNRLAIHLQHLSTLPKIFEVSDDPDFHVEETDKNRKYYEAVQWKSFSHVCTAPVDRGDDPWIVTGAQFYVGSVGLKKVLYLRLRFSLVADSRVRKSEWEGSPGIGQKSGIISTLISTHFSTAQRPPPPRPEEVNINSAVYPGGPPVPVQAPKMLKFVDMTEMTKGPQDNPGYWVVTGARLMVERGKISLNVKYSLLTIITDEEDLG
ncbi:unnamed protein product [Victoria cruziana]